MAKTKKRKHRKLERSLPVMRPNAGGIDIGATEIFVAVPADRDMGNGALVSELYPRLAWLGGLATAMSCGYGGDGIDRGVLDTLVRVVAVAGPDRVSGQCPACEERLGAQVRRAGLPMAAAADELRFVVGSISTQGRDLRVALDHASTHDVVVLPGTAHTAHAKGAVADEHTAGQCHLPTW